MKFGLMFIKLLNSLADLVKWCLIDQAFQKGRCNESIIGTITKSVNYNGKTYDVIVTITPEDIKSKMQYCNDHVYYIH